ncbi:hypothetical protein ACGFX4_37855 [Kitasatospora sp. NPDC048365]|uniref:hypothetical protein n=1 Tax=Kitasatospora sp. NPDC048365 TaxID=3364050 RepID=UPI003714940B
MGIASNSRACKSTGFKDDRPALVYLLQSASEPLKAKIGICEDSEHNTRLAVHASNGWEQVYTRPFAVGLHARLVEAAVKRLWFEERGWEDGRARGESRSDGYTETVLLDNPGRSGPWSVLTPLSLWTDVLVVVEQLGFLLDEELAVEVDGGRTFAAAGLVPTGNWDRCRGGGGAVALAAET